MEINFKERLKQVRCFVFDIDGVMTDGSLVIQHDGTMLRTMNIKDGYAMQLAIKKGYTIFVISGSTPEGVAKRLKNLGVTDVFIGVDNKLSKLESLLIQSRIQLSTILYMGDDMPDLDVMVKCGVPTCPADAVPQIKQQCVYVSDKKGGEGCVRDVIEQVLTLHGHWE